MAKIVVYEHGKLSNGNRYRYFGQSENDKRSGLGLLQWPDSGEDGLSFFALGKFEESFLKGFGLCAFKDSVEIYTDMDAKNNWTANGATVAVRKDTVEFYYLVNGKHAYRSFFFTHNSDVVLVSYYDAKGKKINSEKYRLPFKFVNKTDYLFKDLKDETIPHYYSRDGFTVQSKAGVVASSKHYSLKLFNNGTQIGQFVNDTCSGFGAYYFDKSKDVCLGEYDGTKNNSYVFYTYDSGASIRYGFLDSNDKWQGYVVELDDEHYVNIIEKKDSETVKVYRISDLTLIKDEADPFDELLGSDTPSDVGDDPHKNLSKLIDLTKGDGSTLSVKDHLGGTIEPKVSKGHIGSIEELIGLKSVKDTLRLLINHVKKNKRAGKSLDNFLMHMAFVGNPGTGKTQVAKLLADELHKAGYLPTNKLIMVDRAALVGKYIGESEDKVSNYIKEAMGGVLFIDEAYALHVKDSEKDFGKAVIDTLVKAMEEYKGQFVVILAGYKDETIEMIESNIGLKSRLRRIIEFPDYTREELEQIGHLFLKEYEYEITPEAMSLTSEVVYSKVFEKAFGNARAMRSALETIIMYQSQRTVAEDKMDDFLITMEDVEQFAALEKYEITEKGQDIMGGCFDKLVGLKNVKKLLKLIEAHVNKNKDAISSTHMIFYGNPGTGKTTVARLMAKMLFRAGLLPTDKVIEVDRSDLVAQYTGQTAIKTNEVIRKALGGVLFIDEAYSLTEYEGSGGSYGAEALATLLTAMEEHRDKLCVIFAGYQQEMSKFLKTNSGLSSRILFHIPFDDYDEDELSEIAKILLKESRYTAENDTVHAIAKLALTLKGTNNFANARTIRNFVSQLIMIQSARTGVNEDRTITMEDVKALAEDKGLSLTATKRDIIEPPTYDYIKQLSDEWVESAFVYNKQDTDERVIHLTVTRADGMSEGSGFIITPDGYYVTCNHCIEGGLEIKTRVTYFNRHGKRLYKEYDTVVVAASKEHDCAICKMKDVDVELPYMPLSFEPINTLADNSVVLAGYPHGLRRVNEISFFEGKLISQQNIGGDDKIYTDIMGKSGCSGSAVFYKDTGKVVGVFCGAMLSHNENLTEEMNYLKPISHSIDLLLK